MEFVEGSIYLRICFWGYCVAFLGLGAKKFPLETNL